jgi:hypothetical protein
MDRWLRSVLWDQKLPEAEASAEFEVHRSKGRLIFTNGNVKMLQGVREVFELIDAPPSSDEAPQAGKIILIGRHLVGIDFESSLKHALQ